MKLTDVLRSILGVAQVVAKPLATAIAGPAGGGIVAAIESGVHVLESHHPQATGVMPAAAPTGVSTLLSGTPVPGTVAPLAAHLATAEAIVDDAISAGEAVGILDTTKSEVLKQKLDNFVTALLELKAEIPVALGGFKL